MDLKVAEKQYADSERERKRVLPALFFSWCHRECGSVRIPDRKVETLQLAASILLGKKVQDIKVCEEYQGFTWSPHMDSYNYNLMDLPCEDLEKRYSPVRRIVNMKVKKQGVTK